LVERGEAPMLFIGVKVGNGKGLKVDIQRRHENYPL
jgi:fructose-1,6-bisphosphatase/sedoheptulose 1,7-bisphosphatase-like protein